MFGESDGEMRSPPEKIDKAKTSKKSRYRYESEQKFMNWREKKNIK
jgi:hypothetical protein